MDKEKTECDNTPPSGNVKCIIFTLAIAAGYWFLPPRNKWILLFLLYACYIVLAWYDHWYDCQRNLGPTYLALFYGWAKPAESKQMKTYRNWCPENKKKVLIADLIVLIIFVMLFPFFLQWKQT
jgi:hypothetical protein